MSEPTEQTAVTLTQEDFARMEAINVRIPGWSGIQQYAFFAGVLKARPALRDILMLGVYQGRDIAYILDIAENHFPGRELRIVGVDKFSDTPCNDWPKDKIGQSWEAAGFGRAPSRELARSNIGEIRIPGSVSLIEQPDVVFLASHPQPFDLVYFDTAHDYETVCRQSRSMRLGWCAPDAIICGDDYSDAGEWGVKRAVSECFNSHGVFENWIWHTTISELKTQ